MATDIKHAQFHFLTAAAVHCGWVDYFPGFRTLDALANLASEPPAFGKIIFLNRGHFGFGVGAKFALTI